MRPLKTVDARLLFEHESTFICQNKLQKIKKKYQVRLSDERFAISSLTKNTNTHP